MTVSIFKLFFMLELLCLPLCEEKNKSTNQWLLRVLCKGCYTFSLIKCKWLIKLYSFFNKGYLKSKTIPNYEKLRLKKINRFLYKQSKEVSAWGWGRNKDLITVLTHWTQRSYNRCLKSALYIGTAETVSRIQGFFIHSGEEETSCRDDSFNYFRQLD